MSRVTTIYMYIFPPPPPPHDPLDWIRVFFPRSVCVQVEGIQGEAEVRFHFGKEASAPSWADNQYVRRLSTSFTYVDVDGRRCSMPTMHKNKEFFAHSHDAGYCQF